MRSVAPPLQYPAGVARRSPARFRTWWQSRLPRTDTQTLTQGNVYILPTKAGWMFALTLLVLLIASINYQLNLGYVLTFLLAGSGVVSMHVTHGTLRGLTLHLRPVAAAFAGDPAVLDIVMTSPGTPRFGIGLRLLDAPGATLAWTDVPGGGQATAHVSFVPAARGLREVPTLSAETRFPLGLFRAWTVWRPAARLLVYPRPESGAPAPPAARPIVGGPTRSRQQRERRDRGRARLPPRRPDEAGGVEEGGAGARDRRRAGQPRHQRRRAPGALARLDRVRTARPGRSPLPADRVDPCRRTRRHRLRPAPSRPGCGARRRRDAAPPLSRSARALAGMSAVLPQSWLPHWASWRRLPRDARDTLFLLAVIAWTVLPHAAHLPAWTIALTAVVLLWRGHLALEQRRRCRADGCW